MYNLILKTLRDKRFFMLGWALGLIIFSYGITILYPSFNGNVFDELSATVPAAMQGFIGELENLKQLEGFIGSQVYQINVSLFVFVFAVLLAVGLTVTEEDKGQLRTLVSLPISRRKIVFAKWMAVTLMSLIVSLATTAGVYLGLWQIGEHMSAVALVQLTAMLWLLLTTLASIVLGFGLATGSRALTITVAVLLTAGSYLLTTFAQGVTWLQDFEWLSLLQYFPAPDIANGTFEWVNLVVYVSLLVLALASALLVFPRRDIKS